MATIRANKIASVVYRLGLNRRKIELTDTMRPEVGAVIAVRALGEKRVYNDLELDNGRMSKIFRGDIIVGALGRRRALQGFVGKVPDTIAVGDTLHLLNMGGVIGYSSTLHKDLGEPSRVEVLGAVLRDGQPARVGDSVLPAVSTFDGLDVPPIVLVSGTCMNSGKTYACSQIIQQLSRRGLTVHGGKLSGVACRRDAISMEDHGALRTATFLDAGHPSTAGLDSETMVLAAKSVIAELVSGAPDAIFLELGDGVIGDYGIMPILRDPQIAAAVRVHVFCAGDLVGSWGGHEFLSRNGVPLHVFSGPVTDTAVGTEFIERTFGLPAINARLDPEGLGREVEKLLGIPQAPNATKATNP